MNRSVVLAALAMPMLLQGQTPAKYRYVTTSTTFLDKASFDHSIETMKGAGIDVTAAAATNGAMTQTVTSIVSLSTRDSAGGTVYQINVDSNLVDNGAYRKADRAARAILFPDSRLPALQTTQPSKVVQVFVRNGQPVSLTLYGRPAPNEIDPRHAWFSLQLQLPGLIYLIPGAEMPAKNGGVYQDTSYATRTSASSEGTLMDSDGGARGSITLPGATTYDTTFGVWHRASADTVHSAINRITVRRSENGGVTRAVSGAVYELVFDGSRALHDAKGTTTMTTTTLAAANGTIPPPRKAEQTYSLVKMP